MSSTGPKGPMGTGASVGVAGAYGAYKKTSDVEPRCLCVLVRVVLPMLAGARLHDSHRKMGMSVKQRLGAVSGVGVSRTCYQPLSTTYTQHTGNPPCRQLVFYIQLSKTIISFMAWPPLGERHCAVDGDWGSLLTLASPSLQHTPCIYTCVF